MTIWHILTHPRTTHQISWNSSLKPSVSGYPEIPSSIKIFNSSKLEYEDALKKSGYTEPLIYIPSRPPGRNLNGRKIKIIWFNPPFNANVSTNVAKTFLPLIDKHSPRSNKLNKISNINTVKVSYSCTENMGNILNGHNDKLANAKVRQ